MQYCENAYFTITLKTVRNEFVQLHNVFHRFCKMIVFKFNPIELRMRFIVYNIVRNFIFQQNRCTWWSLIFNSVFMYVFVRFSNLSISSWVSSWTFTRYLFGTKTTRSSKTALNRVVNDDFNSSDSLTVIGFVSPLHFPIASFIPFKILFPSLIDTINMTSVAML